MAHHASPRAYAAKGRSLFDIPHLVGDMEVVHNSPEDEEAIGVAIGKTKSLESV
jgi:hypothetical protein